MLKNPYDLKSQRFGLNGRLSWEDIRKTNLDWWNKVGKQDIKEMPSTKKKNYDFFLQDIKQKTSITFENINNKLVGEICCGPYGGIIQGYDMKCKEKYFIDIFMDDFKDMGLTNWTSNSHFINAPCEHIHLEDEKLDILFGYNSIDVWIVTGKP